MYISGSTSRKLYKVLKICNENFTPIINEKHFTEKSYFFKYTL